MGLRSRTADFVISLCGEAYTDDAIPEGEYCRRCKRRMKGRGSAGGRNEGHREARREQQAYVVCVVCVCLLACKGNKRRSQLTRPSATSSAA